MSSLGDRLTPAAIIAAALRERGVTKDDITAMLVDNPRRILGGRGCVTS